ncbi:CBS domain-containing protein [Fuchsiella alkaliacetigena]|uniref:CBS domain-containing protein n=1 Tax=Fuchsiella alkaliacetigena TaxID=957042 RepID=UPI00200AE361|nr:CBS domain-containing protein [Fuchsiella alkaliacetigena]MCK8825120.1 CBS domain-containing protein [Fuchsiella alkaliacetigena]
MQIKNIMTNDVSSVDPNATVNEAAQIMKNLNVGAVPVCQGNKPVGIITDRDITIRNIATGGDANASVQDSMTTDLVYGEPTMTADEAAQLMAEHQVRRLPIVENNELVGIVSLGDLAVEDQTDMEASEALTEISVPSQPQK